MRSQSRGHSLGLLCNASYPHTSHVLVVLLGVLSLCRPRFPRLLVFLLRRGVCGIGWSLPPGKTRGDPQEQQPSNAISLWLMSHCRHCMGPHSLVIVPATSMGTMSFEVIVLLVLFSPILAAGSSEPEMGPGLLIIMSRCNLIQSSALVIAFVPMSAV